MSFNFCFIVHKYDNCNSNPISRVYVWGLACYGALGNPDLIIPKKARKSKSVSDTMHKPIRYEKMFINLNSIFMANTVLMIYILQQVVQFIKVKRYNYIYIDVPPWK